MDAPDDVDMWICVHLRLDNEFIHFAVPAGSPVPSVPSAKESEQEGETAGDVSCPGPTVSNDSHIGTGGDAPTGARPAPEGNETDAGVVDEEHPELLTQEVLRS